MKFMGQLNNIYVLVFVCCLNQCKPADLNGHRTIQTENHLRLMRVLFSKLDEEGKLSKLKLSNSQDLMQLVDNHVLSEREFKDGWGNWFSIKRQKDSIILISFGKNEKNDNGEKDDITMIYNLGNKQANE